MKWLIGLFLCSKVVDGNTGKGDTVRTENDFNSLLSRELKKLEQLYGTVSLKTSDRFQVGISDFLIWHKTTSIGAEVKFTKTLPKKDGLVLSRPFTGPQRTWLNRFGRTGNGSVGIVGIDSIKTMYVFHHTAIPGSGNWTKSEFDEALRWALPVSFKGQDSLHVRLLDLLNELVLYKTAEEFKTYLASLSEDDDE